MTLDMDEILRFEYDKCQEMFRHYDIITWQISAILFAGVMAFSGIITTKVIEKDLYGWLPFLGLINYFLLICWLMFYFRQRDLYNERANRIIEIEKILEMNHFRKAAQKMFPETHEKNKKKLINVIIDLSLQKVFIHTVFGRISNFQVVILLATIFPWVFFVLYLYKEKNIISIILWILATSFTIWLNLYGLKIKSETKKKVQSETGCVE